MAGTKEGALKAVATIKEKHGEDFFKKVGAIGGVAKSPNKGFGADRERAKLAGMKGGRISRRGKANV